MKAKAKSSKAVRLQLPGNLYRRIEQAAQAARCEVAEVILATLETKLPLLPDGLPAALATDLARWSLLDDEALQAIADAFLPVKQQRRFVALLNKAEQGLLTELEQAEWSTLQQEYLRFSQNKAKAQFLLTQREKAKHVNEATM